MDFLFVYRSGVVAADQADQNIRELWTWLDDLKEKGYEKFRFAGNGRTIVSQYSVDDYTGDVFGISVIEADSLEEAISLTAHWPELQYGGKIEIIEALGQ